MIDPADVDADLAQFEANLRDAFEEMVRLLVAKRRSYGPANLVRFGSAGIVIRAGDKVDRLWRLVQSGSSVSADGDTIDDAFRDLVGYGVLGLLHRQGNLVPGQGGPQ